MTDNRPDYDVREALATDEEVTAFPAEYFKATKMREQVLDVIERAMNERFDIGHIGDAILAAFEVRPHGALMSTVEEARECLDEGWGQYRSLRVVSRLLTRLEEVEEWFAFYNGDTEIGPQGWYGLERILER